jgi:hypothetical protein
VFVRCRLCATTQADLSALLVLEYAGVETGRCAAAPAGWTRDGARQQRLRRRSAGPTKPADLHVCVERVTRIELAFSAWEPVFRVRVRTNANGDGLSGALEIMCEHMRTDANARWTRNGTRGRKVTCAVVSHRVSRVTKRSAAAQIAGSALARHPERGFRALVQRLPGDALLQVIITVINIPPRCARGSIRRSL